MKVELATLKKLCFLYPKKSLLQFQYEVMDSLGFKAMRRPSEEKEALIKEYLSRKYGMSEQDSLLVINLFGQKVQIEDLKKELGIEDGSECSRAKKKTG